MEEFGQGLARLRHVFGYMVSTHEPGAPLPPPPMELKELAEKTVYFASIGAVLQGGLRYAYEKRSGVLAEEGKQLQQSRRGLAEAYRNRLMRVAHSSLQGVGRFGGISALYFGAEFLAAVFRDCRDYYNSTIGGLVAGSFVGASLMAGKGGGSLGRIRGMILGCALGGALGFPAGLIQDALIESLPEEEARVRMIAIEETRKIAAGHGNTVTPFSQYMSLQSTQDPVGNVIAHLEQGLRESKSSQSTQNEKEEEEKVGEQGTPRGTRNFEQDGNAKVSNPGVEEMFRLWQGIVLEPRSSGFQHACVWVDIRVFQLCCCPEPIVIGTLLKAKAGESGAWLWCSKDEMVLDAIRKMTHANVGSLMVFDQKKVDLEAEVEGHKEDSVVGILTERDYLTKVVVKGRNSSNTKVSEIMTPAKNLVMVTPKHSVLDVMELMVEKNFRHVPVVESSGTMTGMVSIKDVVHVMLKEHREEVGRLNEYIQGTF
eukprot:jgi/Picre1/31152/NNA_006506.t1